MLQTAVLEHLAWIEHQFLNGIRDSRKPGSLWGMMRGVGGVRKSIDQSWLAKGLGLGLVCWGFKGVQEEIPSEEASTLHIGSVAFPPGQYTPYSPDHGFWDFCLFPKLRDCRYETIEVIKEAVTKVIDTLTQEDIHGAFQNCWNGTTRALQPENITSKGNRVSCVYYQ